MDGRLYTFKMVTKTQNYTKAAENLNLTQPAVFKQIKYLEEYYGVNLFLKDGRKLQLTQEGKLLLQYAKQLINIHEEVKKRLNQKDIQGEKYSIGATMSIGGYILPRVIYYYMEANKNTTLSLTVSNTNIVLNKLLERDISLALIEGPFDKTKFKYKKYTDNELVLVGPTSGKLSNIEEITLDELLNTSLILREKGSGTRETIEAMLLNHGYSLNVLNNHIEISSINGIKTLVEEGLGLSILSRDTVKKEIDSKLLKIIPIQNIFLTREFNFVYTFDGDLDFINKFIDFSLDNIKQNPNKLK